MKKKEFLAGSLAALMLVTGCSANKSKAENQEGERNLTQFEQSIALIEAMTPEVIEYGEYRISIVTPIQTKDFFGNLHYEAPVGYNLMSKDYDKAYKVEKVTVKTEPAKVDYLEDGTIMYYAPNGGKLSGSQVVSLISTPVSIEESIIVLSNYLNEAELTKVL